MPKPPLCVRATGLLERARREEGDFPEEIRRRIGLLVKPPKCVRWRARHAFEETVREAHSLAPEKQVDFCGIIKARLIEKSGYYERPLGINAAEVEASLNARPDLTWSLSKMEETEGRPDIIYFDPKIFVFGDCSSESPKGRRNIDFLQACKMFKELGVNMMPLEIYVDILQKLGCFDLHSESWLAKPENDREVGMALIGTGSDDIGGLLNALLSAGDDSSIALAGTSDDEGINIIRCPVRLPSNIRGCRGVVEVPRITL